MSINILLNEYDTTKVLLDGMKDQMKKEGKAEATINKYLRDASNYLRFAEGVKGENMPFLSDSTVMEYRDELSLRLKKSSVNSMLAGINYFFGYCGRSELKVRNYRIQRDAFRDDEYDLTIGEYKKLIRTAIEEGKDRLCMIMLTLASTGMRVSELPFVTVESIHEKTATVSLKGKIRHVIIPELLCKHLEYYAKSKGLVSGSIFITRNGRPVDRSNILHDMKKLCIKAGVDPRKVHPHNLRHLFAVTYYDKYKDIVHLADILGHSNINTTRIYTTFSRGELMKNIDDLGMISY